MNCIYVTNGYSVNVVDIQKLPGCTADDYCGDIRTCLNCLARVYCHFNGGNVIAIEHLIDIIKNTITDRAKVNGATVRKLNENWNTNLNICY